MSVSPLPDLDALSFDELKKLVVQLLVRVSALEEEIQRLGAENARLKALPKKPKLAPGGMDKASEPDKRARTKRAGSSAPGRAHPAGDDGANPCHRGPGGLAAPRLRALHRAGSHPGAASHPLPPRALGNTGRPGDHSTAAARGDRPLWPRDRALCRDAARPGAGDGGAPAHPAEGLGRAHLEGPDRHHPDR